MLYSRFSNRYGNVQNTEKYQDKIEAATMILLSKLIYFTSSQLSIKTLNLFIRNYMTLENKLNINKSD